MRDLAYAASEGSRSKLIDLCISIDNRDRIAFSNRLKLCTISFSFMSLRNKSYVLTECTCCPSAPMFHFLLLELRISSLPSIVMTKQAPISPTAFIAISWLHVLIRVSRGYRLRGLRNLLVLQHHNRSPPNLSLFSQLVQDEIRTTYQRP